MTAHIEDIATEIADELPEDSRPETMELVERLKYLTEEYHLPLQTARSQVLDEYQPTGQTTDQEETEPESSDSEKNAEEPGEDSAVEMGTSDQGGSESTETTSDDTDDTGQNESDKVEAGLSVADLYDLSAEEWVDTLGPVRVTELWDSSSDAVAQVGLLGDETGEIKFVAWSKSDLPRVEKGDVVILQNVNTDTYQGRTNIKLHGDTQIRQSETTVAIDKLESVTGALVHFRPGSGLVKRCSASGCSRVLEKGSCQEHGEVDGKFDLRIKGVLDDGVKTYPVLFDAEATASVTGLSLDDAITVARDRGDPNVIEAELAERALGAYYRMDGEALDKYFLVTDCERLSPEQAAESLADVGTGTTQLTTQREVARRVFASEINDATHTFRESDDEYAPRYSLLPTGAKANRVFIAGKLTDVEDVGDETTYLRAKIADPNDDTFWVYAGDDEAACRDRLSRAENGTPVALTAKPRPFQTDGGEMLALLRPERIFRADSETVDLWARDTALRTLERINSFSDSARYGEMAREHYGPDLAPYESAVESNRPDMSNVNNS
jgi:RPA family protein